MAKTTAWYIRRHAGDPLHRNDADRHRGARSRRHDSKIRRRLRHRPWTYFEATSENATDLYEYGKPIVGSARAATAMVGQVWWELIQPLSDEGIFARFLAEKGNGVHHIAVKTPNYNGVIVEVFKGFPDA